MTDFIIALPTADAIWTEESPRPMPSDLMSEWTDGIDKQAYLVPNFNAPDWPGSTYIVGAWNRQTGLQQGQSYDDQEPPNVIGTPDHALSSDYVDFIRPLGNDNRIATGVLDSLRGAGMPSQKFLQDDSRYPATDNPFYIHIVRDDNRAGPLWDPAVTYAANDQVVWDDKGWKSLGGDNLGNEPGVPPPKWEQIDSGYGWTAIMDKQSTSRPPIVNYKVGIYPDADMTPGTEIYFTGAFNDIDGVWQSSAPAGQWTGSPGDVYFALIYSPGGEAQEGILILLAGQDEISAQFWSHDQ